MVSRGRHHQTTDPRRLIKQQKLGKKMSANELELIKQFRERERLRQKKLREFRRQIFGFRKRGRKPAVDRSTSGKFVDHRGSCLLGNNGDLIPSYPQKSRNTRSTTDPMDPSINNSHQQLNSVPFDASSVGPLTNQHLKSCGFYGASISAAFAPDLASDFVISQRVHGAPSSGGQCDCEGCHWFAISSPPYAGTEPTPSPSTPLEYFVFFPGNDTSPDDGHMTVYQCPLYSAIYDCASLSYLGVQFYEKWNAATTCSDLGAYVA
ncbi:hypothetical protein V1509DRAFT_597288 [Lipomyces kononenkoae]